MSILLQPTYGMHGWGGYIAEGMRLGMRVIRSSVIIFRPHSSEVRFYSIIYYYPLGRVWSRGHSEKSLSITAIVAEVRDMKVSLVYDIRPQITTGGSANYLALYV